MRSPHRLVRLLGLIALLAGASALPAAAASTQQTSCADYTSTAAAQFALDINPGLAPDLDPDGNGTACDHEGGGAIVAPTATDLQLPSQTPTAAGQQPQATVDVVDQQPTNTTTAATTQQPGALDGRLGATRPAFEAVHGAPTEELPSETNPSIVGRVYPPPEGAVDLVVIYWNDQAAIVRVTADQPWDSTAAAAVLDDYVPPDVTTLPQPETLADGSLLLPVFSQVLSTGVTADVLAAAGLPGGPGDMYVRLEVDDASLVTDIEVGLGNGDNVREDVAGASTTTTPQVTAAATTPAAAPTPTQAATTTTTDTTAFLQQARTEVDRYQAEIAELRAILSAGTFSEAETQRLSEIIVSWMAVDTTPLNAPPEHAEIANLLQQVRGDLSSIGMILFTVISTGDTTGIQQAVDTLARIEANLVLLDQQLIALGA